MELIRKNRIKAWILRSGLFLFAIVGIFFLIPVHYASYSNIKTHYSPSELLIFDRDGQIIHEVRTNEKVRRLSWVSLSDIRPDTLKIILRAEDQRFFEHHGVDFLAIANAIWQRALHRTRRGASTISMQLADILLNSNNSRFHHRNIWQKINQIRRSLYLELSWSKEEILETYLNLISIRGELQGLSAAAQGLFGKNVSALTPTESSILAALIRSPQAAEKQVLARSCHLMSELGFLCDELKLKKIYRIQPIESETVHALKFLVNKTTTRNVHTTLKRDLQKSVRDVLNREVSRLAEKNMNAAAAVVIDNTSGEILAYVGNVGAPGLGSQVDGAFAMRQAGSTLKPFIYAMAIESKKLTAASVLLDTPTDVAVATGIYRPSNFDHRFRDKVTARTALASSLNIPAVKVLESVGVDNFVETLSQMGVTELERPDYYGPSLALGSADLKLLELTNAYRTFANGGLWSPYHFQTNDSTESKRIFSAETSFIISSILSDRSSRGETFGFDNPLASEFWTAVKTGTSKDMRDNWCIGYSAQFTVGVWAGNLTGEPMWGVSGVQGAAPAWAAIMHALHKNNLSSPPKAPEGLITKEIHLGKSPIEFSEWFIKGTEPPTSQISLVEPASTKIIYPVQDTLVAVDPDIPKKFQKVIFQLVDPKPGQWLRLNGQRLAEAKKEMSWTPAPGRYLLELISANGISIDQTRFQVRKR